MVRVVFILIVLVASIGVACGAASAAEQATAIPVPIDATTMEFDAKHGVLYVAGAETDSRFANHVVRVDPLTGSTKGSINLGFPVSLLALAEDGSFLYAGSPASNTVVRIELDEFEIDLSIDLGGIGGPGAPLGARDIAVMPGSAHVIAVARVEAPNPNTAIGVAVFDHATMRPDTYEVGNASRVSSILFGSDSELFGSDVVSTSRDFFVMAVDSAGVHGLSEHPAFFPETFEHLSAYMEGRVFTEHGNVVDVSSTPALVAELDTKTNINAVDGLETSNTVFTVGLQNADFDRPLIIEEYEPTSLSVLRRIEVPGLAGKPFPTSVAAVGRSNFAIIRGVSSLFLVRTDSDIVTIPVGLVDPSQGLWSLRDAHGNEATFYYGTPHDIPIMGDWNCDGVDTPGLYRQSDGYVYLRNSNSQGIADVRFYFGDPGDVPIAGDFNGDGCDTLSIYRPSQAQFFIINQLGSNDGGLGAADYSFLFGNIGDKPVVGDWDGDSIDEIGLHRESTGFFYFRNTLDTGNASSEFYFGDPGDLFIAGDWGIVDGKDTPGVFRPSNATFYFRYTNAPGVADGQLQWGQSSWVPVTGQFDLDS